MIKKASLLLISVFIVAFSKVNSQSNCDSTSFYQAIKFHQDGQLDQAITKYSEQIKQCPSFAEAYINRGFCYYNESKHDMAHQDFALAVKVSNDKASTLYSIAEIFFNSEIYDTAFIMYKDVAKIDTGNSSAYFKMGRCKWLERIRILQANNVQDYAQDTAFKSHLKDEIMSYYDKAIYFDSIENNNSYLSKSETDAIQDMNTNYEYYYYRGLFKSNFYDYAGALADYEKSIQIHPTIEAYQYSAYLAKKIGQNQKACDYIQTWATMMNPSEQIDPFKKHEIADKFCKDLGIEKK